MAQPSLLNRLVASLFGGGQPSIDDEAERQLIAEAIEALVDTVEPRVRHRAGYAGKDGRSHQHAHLVAPHVDADDCRRRLVLAHGFHGASDAGSCNEPQQQRRDGEDGIDESGVGPVRYSG